MSRQAMPDADYEQVLRTYNDLLSQLYTTQEHIIMKMSQAFPSSFLKASDLGGAMVTVTIGSVTMEKVGEGEEKPCIHFDGKDKGLVLNKTNAAVIVNSYGDESDHWTGKPIQLFSAQVSFQGRMVDAIRVRIPQQQTQAAPSAAAQQPPPNVGMNSDFDDLDIPF